MNLAAPVAQKGMNVHLQRTHICFLRAVDTNSEDSCGFWARNEQDAAIKLGDLDSGELAVA